MHIRTYALMHICTHAEVLTPLRIFFLGTSGLFRSFLQWQDWYRQGLTKYQSNCSSYCFGNVIIINTLVILLFDNSPFLRTLVVIIYRRGVKGGLSDVYCTTLTPQ